MASLPASLEESAPLLRTLHRGLEVDPRTPFLLTTDGRIASRLVDDLARLGLRPALLTDPAELLTAWMDTRPPFILLDARRPEHLAFCARMKRERGLGEVPVTALATDVGVHARKALRDAGVDDWLALPHTSSELAARVRGHTLAPWALRERPSEALHPERPVQVLLVDEDPFAGQVLARYCERKGWHVELEEDAEVAVDRVRDGLVDLLVVDLLVPPEGAFGLLRALRDLAPAPIPRVVVMGAQDPDGSCVRALSLGADEFVAKPFNPAVVVARLGRLVGSP